MCVNAYTFVDIYEQTTNYEERTLTTMKKLFISCPMRGRTNEAIAESHERMKRIAEAVFNEELEIIDSIVSETPPKDHKEAMWYLGKSIEKLAEADYFIGIGYSDYFKGCCIEDSIANKYGIPVFEVPLYFFPDAYELEKRMYTFDTNDYVEREVYPDPNC